MAPYELSPGPCALILERTRKAYEAAIRLEHMTRRGAVPLDASNGQIVDDLIREIEGSARIMPGITREAGAATSRGNAGVVPLFPAKGDNFRSLGPFDGSGAA